MDLDADDMYPDDDIIDYEDLLQAYYDGDIPKDIAEELLANYYNNFDEEAERISLMDLFDRCVVPTITQTYQSLIMLLILCFVFRILCYVVNLISLHRPVAKSSTPSSTLKNNVNDKNGKSLGDRVDESDDTSYYSLLLLHGSSSAFGLIILVIFFNASLLYLLAYAALMFSLIAVVWWRFHRWCGLSAAFITVVYLLICELYMAEPVEWHKTRGAQMVLSMKLISLAFDLDSGDVPRMPGIWQFMGYSFHVGTVIFGPWISYGDYSASLNDKRRPLSFGWITKVIVRAVQALFSVVISTCLVHWYIMDNSSVWLSAYRDAQSFRFSHYFVSFTSEVTALLTGIGAKHSDGKISWDISVARPYHIEAPRSLVEVVTNWNLPMHFWLKTYVFKTAKQPLGNFLAVLMTYAASSLLHGLSFQLAAVLLSLGFYTYIEYVFRSKLSQIFNSCIGSRRCKEDCNHDNKFWSVCVLMTNMLFSGLAVFHLAYLGLMFDSSSNEETGYTMQHTLEKWSDLSYASHWTALGLLIVHLLV